MHDVNYATLLILACRLRWGVSTYVRDHILVGSYARLEHSSELL